jgi:poly(ADP-ribose) glycohydrolase ARH3
MVILHLCYKLILDFFALRFVKEYFSDPRRGYGQQVVDIFRKLRAQKFEDPFGPAKEQFDGSGSYGNGGAMRVAPLALFCHSDYSELINLVRRSAELTHTHKQGYDGTILQVNPKFVYFGIFIMGLILVLFGVT